MTNQASHQVDKYKREAAILGAVTECFNYSNHLTGKARLSGLSDEEARRLLGEARERRRKLLS